MSAHCLICKRALHWPKRGCRSLPERLYSRPDGSEAWLCGRKECETSYDNPSYLLCSVQNTTQARRKR
jgi:hypothetical protein